MNDKIARVIRSIASEKTYGFNREDDSSPVKQVNR